MSEHLDIADLRLNGLRDLCVIKDGDPPFKFDSLDVADGPGLDGPDSAVASFTEPSPGIDHTYWGPK